MGKRTICRIGLLFIMVSGWAQTPQPGFPGGGLWVHPPERMVTFHLANGLILADGSLSGGGGKDSGSLPFVLDTAATATVIDSGVARRLGWAASGPTGAAKYPERTLALAGAAVGGRPVFGLPLTALSSQTGSRIEGIAGSDIFQHFGVRIDYVHRALTLTLPEACATPEKKLRVRLVGGLPFVEASMLTRLASGVTVPVEGMFLIDTGQPGTGLILTAEFLAKHPDLGKKRVSLPGLDSAGAVRPTTFVRLDSFQLGADTLLGVIASVAAPAAGDTGLAGVIGAGVLSRFDLLVDLPRRWLTLKPNSDFGDPFEADMSGMLLLSREGGGRVGEDRGRAGEAAYTVAGIAENSPASDAGLRQGDELVSIGGRRVTEMSMEQIRGMLKSSPGTKLVVGVDRSGKGLQVTLTLRRAI